MKMLSALSNADRRVPVQTRAQQRVASFLEAAAELIAEVGYEAATMTEMAVRTGASLGCVYQYLPNKEAIAQALHRQYNDELEAHLAPLWQDARQLNVREIGERFVERMGEFVEQRPAYWLLLSAPIPLERRHRLREQVGQVLAAANPRLGEAATRLTAAVAVQILQGFGQLQATTPTKAKAMLTAEYRTALGSYLHARLAGDPRRDSTEPGDD